MVKQPAFWRSDSGLSNNGVFLFTIKEHSSAPSERQCHKTRYLQFVQTQFSFLRLKRLLVWLFTVVPPCFLHRHCTINVFFYIYNFEVLSYDKAHPCTLCCISEDMKKLIRMEIQGGSNMTGTNCDLFTHKSVPVIFEPPCISWDLNKALTRFKTGMKMEGKK